VTPIAAESLRLVVATYREHNNAVAAKLGEPVRTAFQELILETREHLLSAQRAGYGTRQSSESIALAVTALAEAVEVRS
jgi:hypothetical protein